MLEYYKFKKIHELFIKGREHEALEQLSELQKRYIALCDSNTNLKIQIQEYEDILYLSRNLVFDEQFYWLITGRIKQGPFCPTCYELDGMLIRLSGEREVRRCSQCNAEFTPPAGVEKTEKLAAGNDNTTNFTYQVSKRQRGKIIPFVR